MILTFEEIVTSRDPNAKFKTVLWPEPLPRRCIACGRGSDGKIHFIDFGMSIDMWGAVLFCTDCYVEGAEAFGLIRPSTAALLKDTVKALVQEREELRNKVAEQENVIMGLRSLDSTSGPVSDSTARVDDLLAQIRSETSKADAPAEPESVKPSDKSTSGKRSGKLLDSSKPKSEPSFKFGT